MRKGFFMLRNIYLKVFCRPIVTLDNRNGISPVVAKQAADVCELFKTGIFVTATDKSNYLTVMRRVGRSPDKFWKVYYSILHSR